MYIYIYHTRISLHMTDNVFFDICTQIQISVAHHKNHISNIISQKSYPPFFGYCMSLDWSSNTFRKLNFHRWQDVAIVTCSSWVFGDPISQQHLRLNGLVWANYSDRSRGHPKWWLVRKSSPKSLQFR